MTYLLDTDVCIAAINLRPRGVRVRLDAELHTGAIVVVSAIAVFELWLGVAKSTNRELNARRLRAFLGGPLELLAFDADDAHAAGFVRAELELRGHPIGAHDALIAGQARVRGMTLVTRNIAEFSRVEGLEVERWD